MEWIDINIELPVEKFIKTYYINKCVISNSDKVQISYKEYNISFRTIGILSNGIWYNEKCEVINNVTHWFPLLPPFSKTIQSNKQNNTMKNEKQIKKITKTAMIELLSNRIGKMLTIKFKKIDNTEKTVNGQYTGHVDKLGWHQFISRGDYNLFDPKNLLEVRVDKTIYQLKK